MQFRLIRDAAFQHGQLVSVRTLVVGNGYVAESLGIADECVVPIQKHIAVRVREIGGHGQAEFAGVVDAKMIMRDVIVEIGSR